MATTTEQLMFVGGDWRASATGETFEHLSESDRGGLSAP